MTHEHKGNHWLRAPDGRILPKTKAETRAPQKELYVRHQKSLHASLPV